MAEETELVLNEEQTNEFRDLFKAWADKYGPEWELSEEQMTITPTMKEGEKKRPILIPKRH